MVILYRLFYIYFNNSIYPKVIFWILLIFHILAVILINIILLPLFLKNNITNILFIISLCITGVLITCKFIFFLIYRSSLKLISFNEKNGTVEK